jgi:lysophospholipase L1-like esterase
MNSKTHDLTRIARYVAIGDSQTEGLHDYHEDGQPRGWSDRFAEHIAASNPELLYANLAVRGKRTAAVRHEQLAAALALEPDLATVVSGVNDVVRRGADIEGVAHDLESMYGALTDKGCLVMGCTFPLPTAGLTRKVAPRLQALNAAVRAAADRKGVLLVELEDVRDASDLRLWSPDRIHLNPAGHQRLAAAFDGTLRGVENETWMDPLPPVAQPSRPQRMASEAIWIARFVVPKVIRMLLGRSSGDGRTAKRPQLSRLGKSPPQ